MREWTEMRMIVLLLALTVLAQASGEGKCGDSLTSSVSFTVASRRNQTGHRNVRFVSQADVQSQETQLQELGHTEELSLAVDHRTSQCDGLEDIHLSAALEVPHRTLRRLDYEFFLGIGYYKMHLNPAKWDEARLTCIREGAHLAIINSAEEAQVLKEIFSRAPKVILNATYSHVAAIGFHDLQEEGRYLTLFGEPLQKAGYMVWGEGQPNNAKTAPDSGSNCGGIERTGKLNDLPCSSRNAFICEQDI